MGRQLGTGADLKAHPPSLSLCPPPPSLSLQGDKVEADLKDARRRGTKLSSELGRLSQEAGRLQAQAEQAATRGRDLLAGAALEQVCIIWGVCMCGGGRGAGDLEQLVHTCD